MRVLFRKAIQPAETEYLQQPRHLLVSKHASASGPFDMNPKTFLTRSSGQCKMFSTQNTFTYSTQSISLTKKEPAIQLLFSSNRFSRPFQSKRTPRILWRNQSYQAPSTTTSTAPCSQFQHPAMVSLTIWPFPFQIVPLQAASY